MELYKLTFPNNKSYIGITSRTAVERFKEHCSESSKCRMLKNAIAKYGKENAIITVLGVFDNWELLCLAEQEAIEKHQTFWKGGKGYNLTFGGDGVITIDMYGDERIVRDKTIRSQYKKEWQKNNKERLNKKSSCYYEENKDRLKRSARDYHEQHKECCLARNREYAKTHREQNTARAAKFQKDNRERTNEKNRLWRASRTPEQKAEIAAKAKARKDANRDEINRKERERRQMKRDLLKSGQG